MVEFIRDSKSFFESGIGEVGTLGKILSDQPIRVFVRSALPGGVRMSEIESRMQGFCDPGMVGEFFAIVSL